MSDSLKAFCVSGSFEFFEHLQSFFYRAELRVREHKGHSKHLL
jgi:hypothetical protein